MQTEEWRESDWVKSETLFPKKEEREGGKGEREMKMEEGEGGGRERTNPPGHLSVHS